MIKVKKPFQGLATVCTIFYRFTIDNSIRIIYLILLKTNLILKIELLFTSIKTELIKTHV